MNKPKLPKANPYIAFCRLKNTELYQCCITDRNMTLPGVFAFKDDENNKRCFHDVKLLNIHLAIDNEEFGEDGELSVNPHIVNDLFKESLEPYGIKVNKVTVHSFSDIECDDFTFTDLEKKEILLDLIDYQFKNK